MSDNCLVIVGLKGKEFEKHFALDDEIVISDNIPIAYAGYGYEFGDVWRYDLNSKARYCPKEILPRLEPEDEGGCIFGIYVVGTLNGAIDLESIQEYIDEAKRIFKERVGQEGKVYVIGEQV